MNITAILVYKIYLMHRWRLLQWGTLLVGNFSFAFLLWKYLENATYINYIGKKHSLKKLQKYVICFITYQMILLNASYIWSRKALMDPEVASKVTKEIYRDRLFNGDFASQHANTFCISVISNFVFKLIITFRSFLCLFHYVNFYYALWLHTWWSLNTKFYRKSIKI